MKKLNLYILFIILANSLCGQEDIELYKMYGSDSTSTNFYDLNGRKIECINEGYCFILKDSVSYYRTANNKPRSFRYQLIQKVDSLGQINWSLPLEVENGAIGINDFYITGNYIYLVGKAVKYSPKKKYDNYKSAIWIGKFDFSGQKIWSNEYHFKNANEAFRITSSKNNELYILGLTSKRFSKLKINFKNPLKEWVKIYKQKGDKVVVMKIDDEGSMKWSKLIGSWKDIYRKRYYHPTSIAVNNADEVCFTINLNIAHHGGKNDYYDTWVVKLNENNIIQNQFLPFVYFEQIIPDGLNGFDLIGKTSTIEHFVSDSIYIYKLDTSNNISQSYCFGSRFNSLSMSAVEFDQKTNTFIMAGFANKNQIKKIGSEWNYIKCDWIGRISIHDNMFSEWTNEKTPFGKINDFDITGKYIFTIGDSWDFNENHKRYSRLTFMKIKK